MKVCSLKKRKKIIIFLGVKPLKLNRFTSQWAPPQPPSPPQKKTNFNKFYIIFCLKFKVSFKFLYLLFWSRFCRFFCSLTYYFFFYPLVKSFKFDLNNFFFFLLIPLRNCRQRKFEL